MAASHHSFVLETPETKTGENLGDSGYEGLHTTPRYFRDVRKRLVRQTKLQFSTKKQKKMKEEISRLYLKLLPYI